MLKNKDKRLLKTEPKLKVQLNEEQKKVHELFHKYDVVFVVGNHATGKTLCSTHIALTSFRKKMFDKIWIMRPMLKNGLGILPGNINEKLNPYVFPLLQNLEVCQGKEETEKMMEKGTLEIMPVSTAKGVTFMNSVCIVDESGDMTYEEFRTILTRLGKDSKMIFCVSQQQIDKRIGKNSCWYSMLKLRDSGLVGWIELKSNHRNSILTKIMNHLEPEEVELPEEEWFKDTHTKIDK